MELPERGQSWAELSKGMEDAGKHDVAWRDGKAAVYVFNAGEDVSRVQREAYALYQAENGLGPAAFPSLKQMEADVVQMALRLLSAPEAAGGAMTSGGTDSITMAVKAARDAARADGRPGPFNIVLPYSAHLAFDKAASLMDIEIRRVPCKDYVADVDAMQRAMDNDTLMLVGSAPSFPFGLIDPISDLSRIAEESNVWLHVDACVGGYIGPFAKQLGEPIPSFDFEQAGVVSMSADLHKYGYAAKGASTVLFRDESMLGHMAFDFDCWPAGRMVTPTLAGTRPGGAIAAAWAVMNFLGAEGYREKHAAVLQARRTIAKGVASLGFEVVGTPLLGILAFTHPDADVFGVYRAMYKKGWVTSACTEPPALHLMLSPIHASVVDQYLSDLSDALSVVTSKPASQPMRAEDIRYS
jgi:sphinganine-1-phosphate aldolase